MFMHISCTYMLTRVVHLWAVLQWLSLWLRWWNSLYIRVCVCDCASTRLTVLSYRYISIKGWRASCEGVLAAKRWLAPSCQVHIIPLTRSTRKSKLTLCSRQCIQFYWPERAHHHFPPYPVTPKATLSCFCVMEKSKRCYPVHLNVFFFGVFCSCECL